MPGIIMFINERAFIPNKSNTEERKNCVDFLFTYLLFNLGVASWKNLGGIKKI